MTHTPMTPPQIGCAPNGSSARITPRQDERNIYKIHRYYQMRITLRHFYPSDFPGNFQRNKERYEEALRLSPEGRQALCTQINRSLAKQAIIVSSALLLFRFIL